MPQPKHPAAKLYLLAFLLLPISCWAQGQRITDSQAGAHVGERVLVDGAVAGVHTSRSGNTFINFGSAYPNQDFTAVIFSENAGAFPNIEGLQGKRPEISGVVRLCKGKPGVCQDMVAGRPGTTPIAMGQGFPVSDYYPEAARAMGLEGRAAVTEDGVRRLDLHHPPAGRRSARPLSRGLAIGVGLWVKPV